MFAEDLEALMAPTTTGSPAPDATWDFDRAVRAVVTERLPVFAATWLTAMLVWAVTLSHGSESARLPALVTLALQAGALAIALVVPRRRPTADVVRLVLVLSLPLALSAIVLFVWVGGIGEILGFVLFTQCALSALLFPWGWRVELGLVLAVLAPFGIAAQWLRFILRPTEIAPVVTLSTLLCIAIAHGHARSFGAALARRASEDKALRSLAASHDIYRDITENARDFIWAADLEGRLTYINDAGARILGHAPSELIGRTVQGYITDHPANPDPTEMRMLLAAGVSLPPTVVQWRTIRGHSWIEMVAYAVRGPDGAVAGLRGISRDVTERVEAEAALRESEARYRGLVESQEALIFRADLEGNLTFLNEACRRKYGVPADSTEQPTFLNFVHPSEQPQAHAALQNVLGGGRYRRTSRGRTPSGWRWIEWEVCAITDGAGMVKEIQGVGHDVTERRAADEALQHSLTTLREREEQLRLMALRQGAIREEERKRLGFDLHDGACQELAGIGILIESARRRGVSAAASSALERAQHYLRQLGEHLRQLARELRPLQLPDLGLGECLRALAQGMATDTVRVTVRFPTEMPRLGEETEVGVYRVAQEALANAVRHAEARTVTLTLEVVEGTVCLEVSDDGRGFERETMRTKALGLVAMEERALALGGRLRIGSQPGAGTTVSLECPLRAS